MKDKQAVIADLYFKGYTRKEIIEKVGLAPRQVTKQLELIKRSLTPKTIKAIDYRRNKLLSKIDLVQKTAWDILTESKSDTIKATLLRLIIPAQRLEAEIQGVVREKLPSEADKKASSLLKEVQAIEQKRSRGGETEEVKERESLPSFLEDAFSRDD